MKYRERGNIAVSKSKEKEVKQTKTQDHSRNNSRSFPNNQRNKLSSPFTHRLEYLMVSMKEQNLDDPMAH